MDVVAPIEVSDATYVAGNLVENDHTEWATGQTIARGDYRRVSSVHSIYQALVDHTSSDSARAAFTTAVNHENGYEVGDTSITVDSAGVADTGINARDTITIGSVTAIVEAVDRGKNALTLTQGLSAAVADNAVVRRVVVPSNSPVSEVAARADPLVADPDPAHWVYISATNKWRLFDGRPSQRASRASTLKAGVQLAGLTRTTSAGLSSRTTSGLVEQTVLLTIAGAGTWAVPAGVTSLRLELDGNGTTFGTESVSGRGATVTINGSAVSWSGFDGGGIQVALDTAGGTDYSDFVYRTSNSRNATGSTPSFWSTFAAGRRYQFRNGPSGTPFPAAGHVAATSGAASYSEDSRELISNYTVTPGEDINYTIAPGGRIRITYGGSGSRTTSFATTRTTSLPNRTASSVALVNIDDCATANVNMRWGGENGIVVYDKTLDCGGGNPHDGIVFDDIPENNSADYISVTLMGGDGLACGQIVIGEKESIGDAQIGDSGFEGIDYSHIEVNIYGDLTTVQREATILHRFDVQISVEKVSEFTVIMNKFRGGKRALWVADSTEGVRGWAYGFLRDWQVYYSDGVYARARLAIQGVV